MIDSGLVEELLQKVFEPERLYRYLEEYNYDLCDDEWLRG